MNIVFHSSVKGKVTLDLVNTPINDAFALVLQIAGLNYYKQNNTLIIIAKNNSDNAAFSKQEMMVFPVKYVNAAKIAEFLNKNVFGMKKAGISSVDAATVNTATNELIVFGMPSDAAIVQKFQKEIEKFAKQAKESGNIDKFAKKALKVKSGNILANVGLSSFLLACALPKISFILRKKVTGSDAEPGLIISEKK